MCVFMRLRSNTGAGQRVALMMTRMAIALENEDDDDDDVYYYIRWRLKLEGETENMGVCTKERKGITAAVREKVGFIEKTAWRQRR